MSYQETNGNDLSSLISSLYRPAMASALQARLSAALGSSEVAQEEQNENVPILTSVQDLDSMIQAAMSEQTEGKYDIALQQYDRIIKAINKTLEVYEIDEENPTTDREYFLMKKQEIEDTCFALRTTMGLIEGGVFSNSQLEDNDEMPTLAELEHEIERYHAGTIMIFLAHAIGLVAASFFLYAEVTDPLFCENDILLRILIYSYILIGLSSIFTACWRRVRLRKIRNNPHRLDPYTMRLWPRGSIQDKIDVRIKTLSRLRYIWFVFAVYILISGLVQDCFEQKIPNIGAEYSTIYFVISFVPFIDIWMESLVCFLLPLLCCFVCCYVGVSYREYLRSRPVGMKQNELNKIITIKFEPGAVDEEHITCSVCLMDFEEGDDIRILPCSGKHAFHTQCIDPWLLQNDTCPQCREHIAEAIKNTK